MTDRSQSPQVLSSDASPGPCPTGVPASSDLTVAIIILHFNRPADVIDSLRRMQSLRARHRFVVVDNGSRAECLAVLRDAPEMAGVTLMAMPHNLGSCAWDFGAEASNADIVIKLDDDSHVETDDLSLLISRFACEPDLGIVPLAIEGGPFPCRDRPSFRRGTAVGFIGCGVAFRMAALRLAGGHDPNFFIYADEWDLAVRILNAGFEIDREARIPVIHRTAQSSGRTSYRLLVYTVRNELLMVRKYFGSIRFLRLMLRVAVWNVHRFRPGVGWRVFPWVIKGIQLGLFDPRMVPVPLRDAPGMLARYEAWYGAFRPLHRHWRLLFPPPNAWVRLKRGWRGFFAAGRKTRVVIFGASRAGMDTFARLPGTMAPVYFVDNDTTRHGQRLLGRTIHAPEHLRDLDGYDCVIVSSMYAPEIFNQLRSLGVPEERLSISERILEDGTWTDPRRPRAAGVKV